MARRFYRRDDISIHALRKESDQSVKPFLLCFTYFNPRSP